MFSVAVDHEYTLTLGGFRIELEFRRTCENDLLFICPIGLSGRVEITFHNEL